MYTHSQTHVHIHVHTRRTHVHIHTCTYSQTHVQLYTCTRTHTPPPIKSCSTSLFTNRIRVLYSRGRQRAQHSLLALLSLRSAIEHSDGSQCQSQIQPELQACSARRPWGTHSALPPHHNFHSP
ncbi:unnamed protein product, partial [Staurois parvus]